MNEIRSTKAAMSVSEMARAVGLSRARFYGLIGKTFPPPVYDLATRRPYYTEELQQVCLDVRRRNCGADGRPVLFYGKRTTPAPVGPKRRRSITTQPPAPKSRHAEIVESVRSLGLTTATATQVESAIRELFPAGTADAAHGEIVRAVFVHLMRRTRGDNVGR